MTDTRERLTEIFQTVLDDDDIELLDPMTVEDLEDWDSLTNVKILVQAEIAFGLRFQTGEVADLQNVGELIELIERKRGL